MKKTSEINDGKEVSVKVYVSTLFVDMVYPTLKINEQTYDVCFSETKF